MLSNLIAKTVRRNPNVTAFHLRRTPGDYGSLVEFLASRMPNDHSRIPTWPPTQWMPVPPTSLRFDSTKPKPATFSNEAWCKDSAKRKLFLFNPHQSRE